MKKKPTKAVSKNDKSTTVNDGWNSVISGLGQDGYDKLSGNNVSADYCPIDPIDAENIYGTDDLGAKIVDEIVDESFREGFELVTEADDLDEKKAIASDMDRLEVGKRFEEAWRWARLYGGAGALIVTDRIQDMALPLDENNIGEIKCLQILSRYELIWNEIDLDLRSPTFGLPKSYRIQPRALAAPASINVIVHASRVIRFDGVTVPRRLYVQNQYWHDSVLTRAQDALKNYHLSHNGIATALQDFSVATYKMKNLAEMVSGGDSNAVLLRMQTIALTRSIARAVVIDADNEGFDYQNRNMSGVPEVLKGIGDRLVAGTKLPHTKLLGESPDGSSATGNSTTLQWYDYVKSQQVQYLKPKLMRILTLMTKARRGPTKGKPVPGLDINFRPLWQQDSLDESTTRLNIAKADETYVGMGAVDPLEVGKSRFGTGKYSMETQIDMGAREGLDIDLSGHDQSADENNATATATNPQVVDPVTTKKGKQDSMAAGIPSKQRAPAVGTSAGNPIEGDLPEKVKPPGESMDEEEDEFAELLGHLFDGMPNDMAMFKDALKGMALPAQRAVALKLMAKTPIHK